MITTERRVKAPGLVWIKRRASFTPYWRAHDLDRKNGYRPSTVNLSRLADDPIALAKRCDELQADMLEWRSARQADPLAFDGTITSLARLYQSHPLSSFQRLKDASVRPYRYYLSRINDELGDRMVDSISGLDLKQWHVEWSNGGRNLAAARMCRSIFKAVVSFGVEARLRGCAELDVALKAASRKLPGPRPREYTIPAEVVLRLRQAAHADGRASSALAYALVFETTLRLWDVIGQGAAARWTGLRWDDIGPDLVMRYVPSKTSTKTGLAVTFPLTKAPMVVEELTHWLEDKRVGPAIVSEVTGLPWMPNCFNARWRRDRKAVGLPDHIWARDLRASGITEARAAGVATDDAGRLPVTLVPGRLPPSTIEPLSRPRRGLRMQG